MGAHVLGISLAKNVFKVHDVDAKDRVVLTLRLRRDQLLPFIANLEPWLIGIEACIGAFNWQRQFEAVGHTVRIIAPQYVKPFVR